MQTLDKVKIIASLDIQEDGFIPDVHIFERIDSTNSWLLAHKQCHVLCLAENQSAGRGRQGRQWVSQATGNIYLSYCYCFDELPRTFPLSTLVVGVAICEALEEVGLQGHGLKWPNDIYINHKKLGGILVETAGSLQQLVIGIGLNINLNEAAQVDQPSCSINEFVEQPIDRNVLIGLIVRNIISELDNIQAEDTKSFTNKWKKWDILQGKAVSVLQGSSNLQGIVAGIDPMGQIGIKLESGQLEYFNSAEIKIHWSS